MTGERRSRDNPERKPFLRGGTIHFGGQHFRVPCVVKEMSAARARLHVFAPQKLPPRFGLEIEVDGLSFECEVMSRGEKCVEVSLKPVGSLSQRAAIPSGPDAKRLCTAVAPEPPAKPVQLWIAEDDADDRSMMAEAFAECGSACELTFLEDGAELIERLTNATGTDCRSGPTLILLDLNMPRMDGRTALQAIRRDPELRHIPVIVFTTSGSEMDVMSTYALGVSAYISKPSRHEELTDIVRFLSGYWSRNVRLPLAARTVTVQ